MPACWTGHPSQDKTAWVVVTKQNLVYAPQPPMETSTFIKISATEKDLVIGTQYAPPSKNLVDNIEEWRQLLKEVNERNENFVLSGDLNARTPLSGYANRDERGKILEELLITEDVILQNDSDSPPTFESGGRQGWPDVTITNNRTDGLIMDWQVSEVPSLSDHKYITFRVNGRPQQIKRRRYKTEFATGKKFKSTIRPSIPSLLRELNEVKTTEQIDNLTTKLQKVLVEAANKSFGKKNIGKATQFHWWNTSLQVQRSKLKAMDRRLQRADPDQKEALQIIRRRERAKYRKQILLSKKKAWETFCTETVAHYGPAYRIGHGKTFKPDQVMVKLGRKCYNREEALSRITDYLFPQPEDAIDPEEPQAPPELDTRNTGKEEIDLTNHEVFSALKQLNEKKAPGPDSIDIRMLRWVHEEQSELLHQWANKCYNLGHFPLPLRIGEVVYFLKKDKEPTDPGSYRPICLLPTLGKLLEKILQKRLVHHLEKGNFLSPSQHGFRTGKSCETALEALKKHLQHQRCEKKQHTAVITVDIKGAFDSVRWRDIRQCLKGTKCPPKLHRTLATYLSQRSVLINWGQGTKTHRIYRGCPQGSCLGPIFWLLVAEPLLKGMKLPPDCTLQAYADDVVLTTSAVQRREMEKNGNDMLVQLEIWLNKYGLQASKEKTTATIVVRKGQKLLKRPPTFKLAGNSVKTTQSFKYLGVTFSRNLSWMEHLEQLKHKTLIQNQHLLKMARTRWGIRSSLFKTWYLTATEKMLTYGSGCWGDDQTDQVKRKLASIQRPYLLRITRAERTAPTSALCVLAGVPPLHLTITKEHKAAKVLRLKSDIQVNNTTIKHNECQTKANKTLLHPSQHETPQCIPNEIQPSEETELAVYTDGSKLEDRVGAAFVVYANGEEIHAERYRLRDENSVFQAEMTAIQEALKWLLLRTEKLISIQSDSKSALQAHTSINLSNPTVLESKKLIRTLEQQGKHLTVSWTKAHVGNMGNERADQLAKEATKQDQVNKEVPLPPSYVKKKLSTERLQNWQLEWDDSPTGRTTHAIIPKVSLTRCVGAPWKVAFLTGHGPFPAHLARLQPDLTGKCTCGEVGKAKHYYTSCPLTSKWHIKPHTVLNKAVWSEHFQSNRQWSKKLLYAWQWLQGNLENIQGN